MLVELKLFSKLSEKAFAECIINIASKQLTTTINNIP